MMCSIGKKSKWYYTPVSSYADMTQLQKLQPVKLALSSRAVRKDGDEIARVRVSNPSRNMAFFIHLQIKQGRTERDVLPVIWQDNYFSLLPGESREVTATYQVRDLGKTGVRLLAVDGWNISPVKTPIIATRKLEPVCRGIQRSLGCAVQPGAFNEWRLGHRDRRACARLLRLKPEMPARSRWGNLKMCALQLRKAQGKLLCSCYVPPWQLARE